MAGLDPDEEASADATGSVDASTPKIQQAWNAWSSKPENNAALLQFGISMLQPRAPGQSGIGALANSIGEGAQASGRVQAQSKADEATAAGEEDKAQQRSTQAYTAESGRITANAHKDSAGLGRSGGLTAAARLSGKFQTWLAKPEDTTGMMSDPVLGAVQKQFPNIKTKADLLADPAAKMAALRIFSTVNPEEDGSNTEVPGSTVAPPVATPTPVNPSYKMPDGRVITWNPAQKAYLYPDGSVAK